MRCLLPALALAAGLHGCASLDAPPALGTQDVIALARSGADAQWIIGRLRESGTVLALSASDILRLHKEGVPREVLDWMQAAQIEELRRREALFGHMYFTHPVFRHSQCPWPLPHPRFGSRFTPWPGC